MLPKTMDSFTSIFCGDVTRTTFPFLIRNLTNIKMVNNYLTNQFLKNTKYGDFLFLIGNLANISKLSNYLTNSDLLYNGIGSTLLIEKITKKIII